MSLETFPDTTERTEQAEALAARLFNDCLSSLELLCLHLGNRLGLNRVLAEHGATTPRQLAEAAGIAERYAIEWLEQQAAAGILQVDNTALEAEDRSYHLPPARADVLVDEENLNYAAPFGNFVVCAAKAILHLVEAYQTGGGVHHSHYDPEHWEGQAAFNRPAFLKLLATRWLPDGAPEVHARLLTDPPARVADIGCGFGWSSIALARAYPKIRAVPAPASQSLTRDTVVRCAPSWLSGSPPNSTSPSPP